ncbi:hypothetical protein ACFYSF_22585 [Streptomyces canus]|uniref:hypothetical protein n=1 Tax=Streptomyces canus TaxID=58343 RepID=UPI0036BB7DD3
MTPDLPEPPQLPEPFAALDHLTAEPTVDQASALTKALKGVPDLQRWLRVQRQLTTRGLLDGNKTAAELAPVLEVGKQRVYDIASGHLNSAALARKAKAEADKPPQLPEPFAALDHLTAEPVVDQARALTKALKGVPDLQRWLRVQRQLTTRGLLDGNKTAAELAPVLEVGKQRVYDIANGHQNSADARRAKAKADKPA